MAKFDGGKPQIYSFMHTHEMALRMLYAVRYYANVKYKSASNWRKDTDQDDFFSRSLESSGRHLKDLFDQDNESGLPHAGLAINQLLIALEAMLSPSLEHTRSKGDILLYPSYEAFCADTKAQYEPDKWSQAWNDTLQTLQASNDPLSLLPTARTIADCSLSFETLARRLASSKPSAYSTDHAFNQAASLFTGLNASALDTDIISDILLNLLSGTEKAIRENAPWTQKFALSFLWQKAPQPGNP